VIVHLKESEVRSESIRSFHSWWLRHSGDEIPSGSDLDPAQIKMLRPHLLIADVELLPFRIRFRSVGSAVVEATGFDFAGLCLDELTPLKADEPCTPDYREAFVRRLPVFGRSVAPSRLRAPFVYEYGMFPLRQRDRAISQFISIEDYFDFKVLPGTWSAHGMKINGFGGSELMPDAPGPLADRMASGR
jgi:hypothetical protein